VGVFGGGEGKVVEVRFIDLCLEGSTKTIRCTMYSER